MTDMQTARKYEEFDHLDGAELESLEQLPGYDAYYDDGPGHGLILIVALLAGMLAFNGLLWVLL
jgi:hypothetical protein